jgi:excisionase family DNA binding protein
VVEEPDGEWVLMVREGPGRDSEFVRELDRLLRRYNAREEYLRRPFSYTEAAAQLGVSRRTLQRWVNNTDGPKVPYTQVGKRPKFTGENIDEIRRMMHRGQLYEEHRPVQQ